MGIDFKGTLTMSTDDKPVLIIDENVVDFIEMIVRSNLMDVDDPKQVHILIERV